MPTTSTGRLAAWLLAAAAGLFGVFFALVAAGERGGETFFSNPALTIPMLGAAVAAVAAGCAGVGAVRRHDRGPVVIAAIVIGAVVILWSVAEIVLPH